MQRRPPRRTAPIIALLILTGAGSLAGCGKYAPPRPPEDFSPGQVESLQVTAQMQGVQFKWSSPDKDLRGRTLKTIEGYRIYRKELVHPHNVLDESVDEELIETIPDTHLAELEGLRRQAEEQGQLTRRVKVDLEKMKFEFTDINVRAGQTYVYRIVPFNQGGVEGAANQLVKVLFRGESSEVALIPFRALLTETL